MSASALLASAIVTTFGLVGLGFVASRKGHQLLAAFWQRQFGCLSPLTICCGAGHNSRSEDNN